MPAVKSTSIPSRQRLGLPLLVLATAQLVISLDYNIVYVALPGIGSGLGFSGQDLQWVVSAYVVTTGGFLLLGGRATDLLGRRRIFVVAALLHAVSSLVGGLAESAGVLVAVRAVQGIGGSLLFPAALSLINTLYNEGPSRNRALAAWGAAGAGGLCFGSLLGGVLVDAFGWPAVFLVNVPLAGAVALAGSLLFPADGPLPGPRDFDLPGALTATVGITLLVFVLVHAPEAGWGSRTVLICAALSAVSLALFAVIQTRVGAPLTPGHLFGQRGLLGAMALTPAMVPSAVVFTDRLPRTGTGKIDRRALGAVVEEQAARAAGESPLEATITRTWAQIFGVERMAPQDDFFDLGAQSLQAIQVANRLGVELGAPGCSSIRRLPVSRAAWSTARLLPRPPPHCPPRCRPTLCSKTASGPPSRPVRPAALARSC
ncbi:MFS transporter [Streptomyces sp. NPDC059629]|uniref:MFS transporter n=1 Tax=Streptomyces sp. NPDC059629 TaxID=3346889 RepID=UPI0036AD817E